MALKQKPQFSNPEMTKELEKAEQNFKEFDDSVKAMTMDRMNQAPKADIEPQTKLSTKEIEKSKDIYLKPFKTIGSREKFNEDYRKEYEHAKEYVNFIAENKEIIGETIELWTKPFAGMPAEEWDVPTNRPLWGPRYLAEQIKRKFYHRLSCKEDVITSRDGTGSWQGQIVVDNTVQRLDALPVSDKKSIFMGASNF